MSHSPLLLSPTPCLCFSVLPIAQQLEEESPWKEGSVGGWGGWAGRGEQQYLPGPFSLRQGKRSQATCTELWYGLDGKGQGSNKQTETQTGEPKFGPHPKSSHSRSPISLPTGFVGPKR